MAKKILIVDDNDKEQKLIKRYFRNAGFEDLIFANRGDVGLQKAIAENPHIVVLDAFLPDMNGFDACKKIRESLPRATKLIVTTGVVDAVDAVKARESGADDYVIKTSDYAPLIHAVKSLD